MTTEPLTDAGFLLLNDIRSRLAAHGVRTCDPTQGAHRLTLRAAIKAAQSLLDRVEGRKGPEPSRVLGLMRGRYVTDRHELIALVAYGHYEARGRVDGHAEEDWFAAERFIDGPPTHELPTPPESENLKAWRRVQAMRDADNAAHPNCLSRDSIPLYLRLEAIFDTLTPDEKVQVRREEADWAWKEMGDYGDDLPSDDSLFRKKTP